MLSFQKDKGFGSTLYSSTLSSTGKRKQCIGGVYWNRPLTTTRQVTKGQQCSLLTTASHKIGPNDRNLPKIQYEKFMKLSGHTSASNSVTNFGYEAHSIKSNGNDVNLLKTAWKSSWNLNEWTYLWRILTIWSHCQPPRPLPSAVQPRTAWMGI